MTPSLRTLPQEARCEKANSIIREVLDENHYVTIVFGKDVSIVESVSEEKTEIRSSLVIEHGGFKKEFGLSGVGENFVDALFDGFSTLFLGQWNFVDQVDVLEVSLNTGCEKKMCGNEDEKVQVEAVLIVGILGKKQLAFRRWANSINKATSMVFLDCVEHFVNADKAVGMLMSALEDSKSRNRGDLQDRYLVQLSRIVESSYCRD